MPPLLRFGVILGKDQVLIDSVAVGIPGFEFLVAQVFIGFVGARTRGWTEANDIPLLDPLGLVDTRGVGRRPGVGLRIKPDVVSCKRHTYRGAHADTAQANA